MVRYHGQCAPLREISDSSYVSTIPESQWAESRIEAGFFILQVPC